MQENNNILIPTIYEEEKGRFISADIMSRLNKERIVFLTGEVTDELATIITAQLLYLEAIDSKSDISLYINSPGGSVSAGMAIYDTINFIKCDVSTICIGLAASMGAFLLSGGTKGKRYALPNAEIMIHQPLGGVNGQASDIEISYKEIEKVKKELYTILSETSGQTYDKVEVDCDRDYWMTSNESIEYGLVDKLISNTNEK